MAADNLLRVGTKLRQLLMVKVHVLSLATSFGFYVDVLGLKPVTVFTPSRPGKDNEVIGPSEACLNFSGSPADPYLVLVRDREGVPNPSYAALTVIGLKVDDVEALVDRVRRAGFSVKLAPVTFSGAVVAIVRDPDDYSVQLVQAPVYLTNNGS